MPVMIVIGAAAILSLYIARVARLAGLPSLLGYMVLGVVMGGSVLSLIHGESLEKLGFVTEIALGFVAFTIGAELNLNTLKKLGSSIITIIFLESLAAFTIVFLGIWLLTSDLPMAIIFGSLAPASAPAGTVAVIQEYKSKGNLTKALYAVVGFDDGLAVIIFGFAAAIAQRLLRAESSATTESILQGLFKPMMELAISLGVGFAIGLIFSFLAKRLKHLVEIPSLIFGFIVLSIGICEKFDLSLILTCMMLGMVLSNTSSKGAVRRIVSQISDYMHLLFILFFFLAGAHLEISALPALGLIGVIYILTRTGGLMGGAWLGAVLGGSEEKIRKYLGLGILSQAGVAIGLALLVSQRFSAIGSAHALRIGTMVIATVTATSIIFEIIGPICAKYALTKAGEIKPKIEDNK